MYIFINSDWDPIDSQKGLDTGPCGSHLGLLMMKKQYIMTNVTYLRSAASDLGLHCVLRPVWPNK